MISTAQPAKSSGNHPASGRQSRESLARSPLQGCPSKMVFMHFISQADDQWGKGSLGRAVKNKCLFLLVKMKWPVLSASHTLLELCFYSRSPFQNSSSLLWSNNVFLAPVTHTGLRFPLDIVQFSHWTKMFPKDPTSTVSQQCCKTTDVSIKH